MAEYTVPYLQSARNSNASLRSLNDRFASYSEHVRTFKEQCKTLEKNLTQTQVKALENQIDELQDIYESKKVQLDEELELLKADKNVIELKANKLDAQNTELSAKLSEETTSRKKLENALADAHRLLSEKDSCIQDCKITIAQVQNALVETQKERDELQSNLTNTQIAADTEAKAKKDLEAQYQKVKDELEFRKQIYDKELTELTNKLTAAERCVEILEDQLRDHDSVDDNLANMIAKMRVQTQNEFQRYQSEAEAAFQSASQDHKNKLDNEIQRRVQAEDETIQCKAVIEELNAKLANSDAKAASLEDQNRSLIHNLQLERTDSSNKIQQLEGKNQELHQQVLDCRQELTAVQNANIPLEMELQGFGLLMDAEEKRLNMLLANPQSELYQNTRGELISSRTPFSGRRSKNGSPTMMKSVAGSAKSRPRTGEELADADKVKLPPLKTPSRTSSPKYEYPGTGSAKTYKPYSTANGTAPVIY